GPGPVGGGAREEIGLLRPISEVEKRDVAFGNARRRRIFSFNGDDAFGVRERRRTEENAVHQAEDRGVRADAESERENGNRGKTFVLEEHPEAITKILKECVHGSLRPCEGCDWIEPRRAARWQITSNQRHEKQQQGNCDEG